MIEAYPLSWPAGRPRTPGQKRFTSLFDTTFARARDQLLREIKLLRNDDDDRFGSEPIISTNLPVRRDGFPYATAGGRMIDPGVAVYFKYAGQMRCFACDRWLGIDENMQAICKTIQALRGIARWGTGDMMNAAFAGFAQIAAPGADRTWREILGFHEKPHGAGIRLQDARDAYRRLAAEHHPDRAGGNAQRMAEINRAWEQAQRELV